MRSVLRLVIVVAAVAPCVAQYVDRIVASVNGTPILWSDVEEEVRIEALMQGAPSEQITAAKRNEALDHLIDSTLVRNQLGEETSSDTEATRQQLAERINSVRSELNATSDPDWQALLTRYALTESEVSRYLRKQMEVLDFIDLRFRSGVQVTPKQIEDYYNQQFVPDLKKRGATAPPLSAVRSQIENILVEQAISASTSQWLKIVREQAEIWRAEPFANSEEAQRE